MIPFESVDEIITTYYNWKLLSRTFLYKVVLTFESVTIKVIFINP